MNRPLMGMRAAQHPSLVRVYEEVNGELGKFLRYETANGIPCDERGVKLGVVSFFASPPDPEDEEDTGLEPEEVTKDAEGGKQ